MTVTERQSPETDYIKWHENNRCTRHLLFPWRAEHEVGHCNWGGVFYSKSEAEHALATHECKLTYRRMNGMSILEQYWLELDRVIDEIKEYGSGNVPISAEGDKELLRLQGRAGGLAFALVVGATPYFADEKAVSKEALRRWKMRNGQMEWQPTPSFKYNPPPPGANPSVGHDAPPTYTQEHNKSSSPVAAPPSGRRRRAAATPVEKTLTEQEVATIKLAGSGFPAADLAKMYGVSEATIKTLIGTT